MVDPVGNARRRRWLAAVATLVVALCMVLSGHRFAPPAPLPASAPPEVFSAERALSTLRLLLGDGRPHPTGSAAAARVRGRIIERLRALGLAPQVQVGRSCRSAHRCATVHNVVATLDGGEQVLLLAAHYDSIAAGPGAADDGAGVAAVLEIARALLAARRPRHTVALLLDEGEEQGLLGAELFVRRHPLWRRVQAVINLEARGSRGPSLMFETAGPTGPLLARYAASVERPASSSLFGAIYRHMPNDTDFSVFRRGGAVGYNFAFIGGVEHYHSPHDDLAHLSAASLQHQGQSALALTRMLLRTDLSALRLGQDAVWFDLLGLGVVHWPTHQSLPLAIIACLLMFAALLRFARRDGALTRAWLLGLAGASLSLLMAIVVGAVMALAALEVQPLPVAGPAMWLAMLAATSAALAAGVWLQRRWRLGRWHGYLALWSLWCWLALLMCAVLVEGCYLFLLPALAAALSAQLAHRVPAQGAMGCVLAAAPAAITAVLWAPVALGLLDAGGLLAAPLVMFAAVACLLGVGPLWLGGAGHLGQPSPTGR